MSQIIRTIAGSVEENLWLVRSVALARRGRWRKRRPFNYTPVAESELYWPLPDYYQLVSLRTRAHYGFYLVGPGTYKVGEHNVWTLGQNVAVTGYRILGDHIILGVGPRGDPFRDVITYSPDVVVISLGIMTIYKRKKENHCNIFEVVSHEYNNVTTFLTDIHYRIICARLE